LSSKLEVEEPTVWRKRTQNKQKGTNRTLKTHK